MGDRVQLVLLDYSYVGGLYKVVDAPQGKDGSAMDVMAAAKVIIVNEGIVTRRVYIGQQDTLGPCL